MQGLAAIVAVLLILWYARETYLLRLATITGDAPSVRATIHYDPARPRLRVENVEGRIAYNVRLDGFTGFLQQQEDDGTKTTWPVRCTFERIDQLAPQAGANLDLSVESPDESHVFDEGLILRVLGSATGRVRGLPLRLRYEDRTGMRYLVRVAMPNAIELGFGLKPQPMCSPPLPMTTAARLWAHTVWAATDAFSRQAIRRERALGQRTPRNQ